MQDSTAYHLFAGIAIALVLLVCFTMPASGSLQRETLVVLIDKSCDYYDFYNEQLGYAIYCSQYQTLSENLERFALLSKYYNVVYVVDELQELPKTNTPFPVGGMAYFEQNYAVAWRYVEVINHEADHLACDCDFHDTESAAIEEAYS